MLWIPRFLTSLIIFRVNYVESQGIPDIFHGIVQKCAYVSGSGHKIPSQNQKGSGPKIFSFWFL